MLELIREAEAKTGIKRREAELILSGLLKIGPSELHFYEGIVDDSVLNSFYKSIAERNTGKPVQYIMGETEFMGLGFNVNPDVLIPRPETEIMVEEIVKLSKSMKRPLKLLDLCTGSGNIAISLTKFITDCKIMASDVSEKALAQASENARRNGCFDAVEFILSDLFEKIPSEKFDIIVSNPPYVPSADIGTLQKEIAFEPELALDGGADGLDFYRKIARISGRFLANGGYLVLEMGCGQSARVKEILQANRFSGIRHILDYNSLDRVAIAQWTN